MSINLTDQDKQTVRTAAYGAVSLLSAAAAADSPHKVATAGAIALNSATGPIGHVLAAKTNDIKLPGKSVAEIADYVLPALTEAAALLKKQDAAEAENFRGAVTVAIEAAMKAGKGEPSPAVTEMARKITAALDAA
ncbi:hypothetical protein G5C51_40250 [Streptomyces sp. A7024]|uniref:D-alanyl-D-alanine carboxypeptidase n=1 Tax=Streptomyces coryli TaxID=1128680 RepID=A0A6G4UES2_9ACTN|nr:hypothetical protein [Streptomyces coryli]NGN70107.1 hypothetical protein [Streptomyces coryli]